MKVGFVGLGTVFPLHLATLKRSPGVTLIGGCDANPQAASVAAEQGLRFFPSLDALLQAAPDVVHVLVPPQQHVTVAKEVLQNKVNCFLEKPAAVNMAEFRDLVLTVEKSGRLLGINHTQLFNPSFEDAIRAIRDQELGAIEHVHVHYQVATAFGQDHFVRRRRTNVVWELAPHPLSLICYLLGRTHECLVNDMSARSATFHQRWHATFSCDRGTATCYLCAEANFDDLHMTVQGEDGSVHINLLHSHTTPLRRRSDVSLLDSTLSGITAGISLIQQSASAASFAAQTAWKERRFTSVFDRSMAKGIHDFYRAISTSSGYKSDIQLAELVTEACQSVVEALEC